MLKAGANYKSCNRGGGCESCLRLRSGGTRAIEEINNKNRIDILIGADLG
jgi:hypothetical protein